MSNGIGSNCVGSVEESTMTPHLYRLRGILGLYIMNRNVSSITKIVVAMSFFPKIIIFFVIRNLCIQTGLVRNPVYPLGVRRS